MSGIKKPAMLAATLLLSNQQLGDTKQLADKLAAHVRAGDCIALSGEVGAGKTTFAQFFIGALTDKKETITSPTFNIVQWYDTSKPWRVCHADLYRIEDESALIELGLEEAFESHVTLIEWPEIAAAVLPHDTLHIAIDCKNEQERIFTLKSHSARWQEWFKAMESMHA